MKAANLNNRLNYLDGVRAFALLLGIVFHASLSFVPVFIGWAVMDISTGSPIKGFILVSHSFRMELFFLIAGFFSHMTFHRMGAGNFIGSRLTRIAIPFVAGGFILKPLIISSWVMGGESMRGEVNVVNGLKTGFQSLGQLPKEFLTGTHLWFLYYLLLVTAIILVIRALVSLLPGFYAFAANWADKIVVWVANSRFSLLALSLPTAACLWYMNNWGMDTPDKSLVPQVPVLLVYCGFFSFGWLLHRQKELIERFSRITWGGVALCILSIGATFVLSDYQGDTGHPEFNLIRTGFALGYAIMMWSLVALSMGLFKRFFDRPSRFVQYIADASYWLYLIHLPIVIWLQIAFAELPLHWSLKLIMISLLTIGISLALYDLCVRSTLIGKTLNGRTKESVLFRRGLNERGQVKGLEDYQSKNSFIHNKL